MTQHAPGASSSQPSGSSQQSPPTSPVIHRNIAALLEVRRREKQQKKLSERVADAITTFAGSMWCIYAHLVLVGIWIVLNLGRIGGVKPWDPPPFVMLAMIASVEAIFLSTFVLISQNRMQKQADKRAELDLQISLLTEHELTRAIELLDGVSRRVHAPRPPESELADLRRDIHPLSVVQEIERAEDESAREQQEGKAGE